MTRVARTVRAISPEALHCEPVKLVVCQLVERRSRCLRHRPHHPERAIARLGAEREGDEEEDSVIVSRDARLCRR